jgi:uncharacterized RDD family membrane protein YckC
MSVTLARKRIRQIQTPSGVWICRIQTPEGVSLPFEVATVGERLGAFLIDTVAIYGAVALVMIAGFFALGTGGSKITLAFAMVFAFFLRNFYFVYTEMSWGGQTLGKRVVGLRVITRDGGPLSAEALFARNLTRDLEVFLPLTALAYPEQVAPGAPSWGIFISTAWIFVFALLPLFSKDRLRCGDLVGGTLVVRAPRATLLTDVVEWTPMGEVPEGDDDDTLTFTPEQLDLYGIHELQVLEDILRRADLDRDMELAERVARTIREKIGWSADHRIDAYPFLLAFYKAQRKRLEQRLLLGERRERKRE